MPVISRFQGIVITMNYRDHNPPHFHARQGDEEVLVEIESGVVRGRMTRRTVRIILQWLIRHRPELRENWGRASRREPLHFIPPLEEP